MALCAARLKASMSEGPTTAMFGDAAVLVDVELQHDAATEGHRRVRHEPVAADLRDEPAQPRAELDALGVELNRGARIRSRRPEGCGRSRSARSVRGSGGRHQAPPAPARRLSATAARRVSAGGSTWATCSCGSGAGGARVGLHRSLRSSGPLLRCGLGPLGRVPSRERQRILWLLRALRCLCPPIEIRRIGARRRLRRLHVDLGCTNTKRVSSRSRSMLALQFLPACFELFRAGLEEVESRAELEHRMIRSVHDDRQQDAPPARRWRCRRRARPGSDSSKSKCINNLAKLYQPVLRSDIR